MVGSVKREIVKRLKDKQKKMPSRGQGYLKESFTDEAVTTCRDGLLRGLHSDKGLAEEDRLQSFRFATWDSTLENLKAALKSAAEETNCGTTSVRTRLMSNRHHEALHGSSKHAVHL